ncbi:hypothetical protein V9L05_16815 [Bernardetia sp. Wsw4-3y2]|uniref:hypothetical protein n=1 Tax=Bernardetia sp. Wsw4-3y2 TaxID=3127471 RepID=UPI0030D32707
MENQPYAVFDYSELPLVQGKMTGAETNDANFAAYLEEINSISMKAERYISILDMTKASYLAAKYRIMQGKYLEENNERIQKQAIAIIFIAPSFLHRTLLKGVFFIKPYPSPVFIVSSKEEAQKKAQELLEEEQTKLNI